MKKITLTFIALLTLTLTASAGFLDSATYSLTSNSASRTIIVTNWPGSSYEWYPSSILLNNRGGTTGDILALADEISVKVYDKFGIKLEKEPVLAGF